MSDLCASNNVSNQFARLERDRSCIKIPFKRSAFGKNPIRFVSVAPILTEVDCDWTGLRRSLKVPGLDWTRLKARCSD